MINNSSHSKLWLSTNEDEISLTSIPDVIKCSSNAHQLIILSYIFKICHTVRQFFYARKPLTVVGPATLILLHFGDDFFLQRKSFFLHFFTAALKALEILMPFTVVYDDRWNSAFSDHLIKLSCLCFSYWVSLHRFALQVRL